MGGEFVCFPYTCTYVLTIQAGVNIMSANIYVKFLQVYNKETKRLTYLYLHRMHQHVYAGMCTRGDKGAPVLTCTHIQTMQIS